MTTDMNGPVDGKALVVFSAAEGNQISGTLDEQGHGLFTYYFLRGLNGAAKDISGTVTVDSLYAYVRPNVQDSARKDNRQQNPLILPATMGERGNWKLR